MGHEDQGKIWWWLYITFPSPNLNLEVDFWPMASSGESFTSCYLVSLQINWHLWDSKVPSTLTGYIWRWTLTEPKSTRSCLFLWCTRWNYEWHMDRWTEAKRLCNSYELTHPHTPETLAQTYCSCTHTHAHTHAHTASTEESAAPNRGPGIM